MVSIIDDISGEIMRVSIINGGFSKQMKVFAGIHVLLLVLFFCGEFSQAAKLGNSLGLKTAPMPKYQAGTTLVYSDGSWETVIKVGPEGITWRNHRGSISTGSPDFIYKRFKWQTKKRYGYRDFKQTTFLMSPPTPPLWPLEVGNKTRFDEKGRWFDELGVESRYDSFWSCEVIGTEKVSVGAGDFDTWKITCKRYPDKFRSTSKTREYRTWYYAPIVKHWVIEDRDYNGYRENRSKELVAHYRPIIRQLVTMAFTGAKNFDPAWAYQTPSYSRELILEKECRYFVEAFADDVADVDHDQRLGQRGNQEEGADDAQP